MGSVGDAYDEALAQSQIGLNKNTELVNVNDPWWGTEHVEVDTLDWVRWFNPERTHRSISDLTPIEAEQIYSRVTTLTEAD